MASTYTFSRRLTLLTTIFALLMVSATADPIHKVSCYSKVIKCCFKFAPCGVVVKKVVLKPRCDFKKCKKVCKPVCKVVPKKVVKKVCGPHGCYDKFVVFDQKICKSVCTDVCKLFKAVCPSTKVFHLVKFCAKAVCGKQEIVGSTVAPHDFVGKVKKLVSVIPGERKIFDDGLPH